MVIAEDSSGELFSDKRKLGEIQGAQSYSPHVDGQTTEESQHPTICTLLMHVRFRFPKMGCLIGLYAGENVGAITRSPRRHSNSRHEWIVWENYGGISLDSGINLTRLIEPIIKL